jgi:flagellar capping protein FliD
MIVYDLGRNIANSARESVAQIFNITVTQMHNSKAKKLKKSETMVGMINHLTYNIWNSQYQITKRILTVQQEIRKEEVSWEEKYDLLEGELEIMYHELEDYAKKKYQLNVDTSINALKEKKKFWSITLLEQNNLQPPENNEPTQLVQ